MKDYHKSNNISITEAFLIKPSITKRKDFACRDKVDNIEKDRPWGNFLFRAIYSF